MHKFSQKKKLSARAAEMSVDKAMRNKPTSKFGSIK